MSQPLPKDKKSLLALDISKIKNAQKRHQVLARQRKLKGELHVAEKQRKLRELALLGPDEAPKVQKPRTIENTAEPHHTVVQEGDEEVQGEEEMDEYASYFTQEVAPKICITTCVQPSRRLYDFVTELLYVFPNSFFYPRKKFTMKQITESCIKHEFTDIIVINQDSNNINGLTVTHLPEGPTAYFQLRSVRLHKEIGAENGSLQQLGRPEVLLNRFTSRIGKRCGRILGCLFHIDPTFKGRRVITFHNQRDFIFFRHHRYIFERVSKADAENDEEVQKLQDRQRILKKIAKVDKKTRKELQKMQAAPTLLAGQTIINKTKVNCDIQPIGPEFTMCLKWIQHGVWDVASGEYEWKLNNDMKTHKTKFHL